MLTPEQLDAAARYLCGLEGKEPTEAHLLYTRAVLRNHATAHEALEHGVLRGAAPIPPVGAAHGCQARVPCATLNDCDGSCAPYIAGPGEQAPDVTMVRVPRDVGKSVLVSSNARKHLAHRMQLQRIWEALNVNSTDEALQEIQRLYDLNSAADPEPTVGAVTATSGMNLEQRILHVGGRNNAAGYVEFGSVQAVHALVQQVLRDTTTPALDIQAGVAPAPAFAKGLQEHTGPVTYLPQGPSGNTLADFNADQWWVSVLQATADNYGRFNNPEHEAQFKRSVAVVLNLLATVKAHLEVTSAEHTTEALVEQVEGAK